MKARIKTERLIIRNFREEDAQSMFASYCSFENVTRYLTWYPHENVEQTRLFLKNVSLASIDETNSLELAITLKEDESYVIGSISVVNQFENQIAEIGYVIGEKYWNQGYMSETFSAFIDYLFQWTPILKVRALHDQHNPASGKVMQKCGLQKIGECMSQKKFDKDEQTACFVYEISKEMWQSQNKS